MQFDSLVRSAACLLACLPVLPAGAQVVNYGLEYSLFYSQVGYEPDSTPHGVYAVFRLTTSDVADLESASVTPPNGPVAPLQKLDEGFYVTSTFSTESEMLDAYPAGEYLISGSGGDLQSVEVSFIRPENPLWPYEIPSFFPETVDAAQGIDPNSDLVLQFNSWTSDPEANEKYGYLYVIDSQNGSLLYWADIGPLETSHTIQAGALPPDSVLTAELFFSSRFTQYVDSALTFVGYNRVTLLQLNVGSGGNPCVGDLNFDGFVDDADFVEFVFAYDLLDCEDGSMPFGCPADFDHDGVVDDGDFVVFVSAYNQLVCP